MEEVRVRDKRKENRYYADNEFIDGYAKYVGWQGQCVYHALCRHAKGETCFPSLKHLAYELGISTDSVGRAIKKLNDWNIINVKRRGKTQSNIYSLLDRSEWSKNEILYNEKGEAIIKKGRLISWFNHGKMGVIPPTAVSGDSAKVIPPTAVVR